jgi:hypothetical protein
MCANEGTSMRSLQSAQKPEHESIGGVLKGWKIDEIVVFLFGALKRVRLRSLYLPGPGCVAGGACFSNHFIRMHLGLVN